MKLAILGLVLVLGGCAELPGLLSNQNQGVTAPVGTNRVTEAVDGLIVGHRLMAAAEYELALKAYSRAVTTQGLTSDVLSAIGSANMRLGRLYQAEKFLENAVDRDPDFVPAWNNLGVVQMSLGNLPGARASFQRAYALDNGNSDEIRDNLRNVIHLIGDFSAENPPDFDFMLVRRGNGRYLLLGQ